ncbi:Asp-tRNA(Asn)/Glu-tRNA(Gln) amidotransferase subunit GatB [Acetobacteraceae bacterium]|nr:Asp-tRNA(Asn)/Glu-tRNA(Gln) amidotransferase subunit GatB [Candidatus Parcubacteria bacterium]
MSDYRVTIGLEIHAELKTRTKMFCACLNNPDEAAANKNICPVCMAHPGTLPVVNKEAVHKVLLVGSALGGTLADFTEFDRKNYFYPDIPKGYQISQYKHPLIKGGMLHGVALTRIHLEEDTARSQHVGIKSLVDFNRAGVPLMELVTEPVIHSASDAGAFARELQLLLRYVGAGEANMEKGEMRVEANISIARSDLADSSKVGPLGTKVEVKNINSFRAVERAIVFELERQEAVLEKGEKVVQETRGWDEEKQITFSQRKKESSHDYRYFPDPDLPKLMLSEIPEFSLQSLKKELPELPWEKRARYTDSGIIPEHAEMFIQNETFGALFEQTVALLPLEQKLIANYIGSDIAGLVSKNGEEGLKNITATGFASSIAAVSEGKISSRGVKDAIAEVFMRGGDLAEIHKKYLQQGDEGVLLTIAKKVVEANPQSAEDYKAGKEVALQFLVGQGMRESKGSANPQALRDAIQKVLR